MEIWHKNHYKSSNINLLMQFAVNYLICIERSPSPGKVMQPLLHQQSKRMIFN